MGIVKVKGLDGKPRDYIIYSKAIPSHPKSDNIMAIRTDRFRYHCGEGDMWPLTWGRDGNIYAAAGDNKSSPMNFWKISQYSSWNENHGIDPGKLTNTNDWTIDLVHNLPVDPKIYCTNPVAPSIKPAGLLDIDGMLYFSVQAHNYGDNPYFNRQKNLHGWIITSDNYGLSWNLHATDTDFFTGRLASCHFLQFGRGYEDSRDSYVYAYFTADEDGFSYWENADYMLLGRVHKNKLLDRSGWEFYTGLDESWNAIWNTDDSKAKPVFSYYKMTGENHVCYNKYLGLYIMGNYSFIDNELRPRPIHQMSWPEAYRSQLTLFEAKEPWGPWHIFHCDNNWGTYGDYQPNFPTKWIFEDGRLMFMVSSGSWDDYNFVVQKIALKCKGDKDFCNASKYFDYK